MRVRNCRSGDKKTPDSHVCNRPGRKSKLLVVAVLFALCLGPTFISYQRYSFQWDDSDYFARAIAVSLAFLSGNWRELITWMVSHHPPAMALMGVPWGPLQSWPAAGNCFVTLSAVISLLAPICLYLSLRL